MHRITPALLAGCLFLGIPAQASTLTLNEALHLAVQKNPEIQAARAAVQASQAEHSILSRLPNPTAEAEAEEIGGKDDTRASFWIRQPLLLNGQRTHELKAAERREERAKWETQAKINEVLFQVRSAFSSACFAKQREELAKETLGLSTEVARAARTRFQAAAGSEMDALRAEAEVEKSRIEAEAFGRETLKRRMELAIAVGEPTLASMTLLPSDPPRPASLDSIDSLLARLPRENPKLLAARESCLAAEAEHSQARAGVFANPEVGVGVVRRIELRDTLLSTSIGWPLPLFGRNQEEIERGEALLEQAQAEETACRNETALLLRQRVSDYLSQERTVRLYRENLLATAEEAFRKASLSYRLGRASYLDLLEAKRQRTEANLGLLEARERQTLSAYAIESLFTESQR